MKNISLFLIMFLFSGCASLIKDSNQNIIFNTYPDNAKLEIKNSKGLLIHQATTPSIITLNRSNGSYFGSEIYDVTITKEGYVTKNLKVQSKANNFFLFGNILFGNIIGWFIVDPLTGRMYDLEPEMIDEILTKVK